MDFSSVIEISSRFFSRLSSTEGSLPLVIFEVARTLLTSGSFHSEGPVLIGVPTSLRFAAPPVLDHPGFPHLVPNYVDIF